jgi:hypothetical protein
MKRPNRYPYTRSQWEKITLIIPSSNGEMAFTFYENRLTGEEREE